MSLPRFLSRTLLLLIALLGAACATPAATSTPRPSGRALATTIPTPTTTATRPPPTATATAIVSPTVTATPVPTATRCAGAGRVVAGTYASASAGAPQKVRIYLPPCYGADGRVYPTLYLFAGNIHDERKWDELGMDEAATAAIATEEIAPLLVVMADGGWMANNTSGGPGSFETVVLDDLIPFVESHTCSWPEPAGRAIGGLSRGGYWALEIAFRFPTHFVSVGGHSAALIDSYAGPAVNPQYTGLSNDLGDLRVYLDIGAGDYLIANMRRLHEEMAAAGVAHTWVLNEGKHEDAYWAGHVADYLAWYAAPWPLDRTAYPPCPLAP